MQSPETYIWSSLFITKFLGKFYPFLDNKFGMIHLMSRHIFVCIILFSQYQYCLSVSLMNSLILCYITIVQSLSNKIFRAVHPWDGSLYDCQNIVSKETVMAESEPVKETAPGPSSAWPNSAKDYELKEVIGVGATAVVQVILELFH